MVKKLKKTIMNFNKKSNFFFHIENFLKFIPKIKNKNYLKPNGKEIDELNNLIKMYENIISGDEIKERKIIEIKKDFYEGLKNFESVNKIKRDYETKVENVIKFLNKENIKINLKNIQIKFQELYNKKYSLMTFSRILKNHLNLHFLKTKLKNPKLKKNLYIFMTHFFIKGIVRALSLNLKLLYIDESAFKLINNNYYVWREKNGVIIGGAENDLKKQLNMISAIDDSKVLYYKLVDKPINHMIFKEFFSELLEKIWEKNIKNYLIIFDNAKCHIAKSTKKYLMRRKIKILTNIPYYSEFNAIEFLFLNIKSYLYKLLIKNRKELKKEIESFINNEKLKITITKIYLGTLKRYLKFINDNSSEDMNEIFENI